MIKIHLKQKSQLIIHKWKGVGLQNYDDSKAFFEFSNNIDDVYQNIEENSLNNEPKILIEFDDWLLICFVIKI